MNGPPLNPGQERRESFVEVIPLGRVDETACDVAAANLQALMDLPAKILPPLPTPAYAHLPARQQYDAGLILKNMTQGLLPFQIRLGITELDLCLPILSYVYGEALLGGRLAILSLNRLGYLSNGRPAESALLYERLAKVALHEVSHALGIPHCRETGCLMRFSPGLSNLDQLSLHFCPRCKGALNHIRSQSVRKDK